MARTGTRKRSRAKVSSIRKGIHELFGGGSKDAVKYSVLGKGVKVQNYSQK